MPMNGAFRAQWKAAGYSSECGSAAVVAPPPQNFIRVYHVTAAEYAISTIGLGRIKVARFADLNDPFELMAANFRERRTRNVIRNLKNAYDSHTGLLCFSADWINPVLWSHYGAKHRGICLGFNLERTRAQKVRYEDERLLFSISETGDPNTIDAELRDLLLCTKFRHWQYEQELRVFLPLEDAQKEGTLHFYPLNQDLQLAEVILGPQCTLSLDAVRNLTRARYPDAVTYRARLAWKWFAVVPEESTVP
jgi:hypothetical protein